MLTMRAQSHFSNEYPSTGEYTETLGSRASQYTQATRDSAYTITDSYYTGQESDSRRGRESALSSTSTTHPFQYASYESRQSVSSTLHSARPESQEPAHFEPEHPTYTPKNEHGPPAVQAEETSFIETPARAISPTRAEFPLTPNSPDSPESPSSTRSSRVRPNTIGSRNFSRPFNLAQEGPAEPLPLPRQINAKPSLGSMRSMSNSSTRYKTSPKQHQEPEIVILERNRPSHPSNGAHPGFNRSVSDASARSIAQSEPYFHRPPLTPAHSDYAKSDSGHGPSVDHSPISLSSSPNDQIDQTSPTKKPNKLRRKQSKASIKRSQSTASNKIISSPILEGSEEVPPHSPTDSDGISTMSKRSGRWKSFFSLGSIKRDSSDTQHWRDSLPPTSAATSAAPPEIVFSPPALTQDMDPEADWKRMQHRHAEQEKAEEDQRRMTYHQQQQQFQYSLTPASRPNLRPEDEETEQLSPDLLDDERQIRKKGSTNSVYSAYSIYSLPADDGNSSAGSHSPHHSPTASISRPTHSPSASQTLNHNALAKAKQSIANLKIPVSPAKKHAQQASDRTLSEEDPMDCLLLGIEQHESGDLSRSAYFFEKSARIKGGIGPGMLLFGLTLLHGWGVSKDEEKGFTWLQKAAESVVHDLDSAIQRGKLDSKDGESSRFELVLAVYELGMCFRRGWGVKKDKKMAIQYFELAANLGDPDAQNELAFCYLNGKGCKRDKKKAAKYYRMAAAQGNEVWGMHWITKEKYDEHEKS